MTNLVTDETFDQVIKNNQKVLIDVWAEWCGPCKMIGPVVDELAIENEDIYVGKLNADSNSTTMQEYQIRSIPTLLLFKDGELKDKIIGAVPKKIIAEKLEVL